MGFFKGLINVIWSIITFLSIGAGSVCVLGVLGRWIFEGKMTLHDESLLYFIIMIPLLLVAIFNLGRSRKPFGGSRYDDDRPMQRVSDRRTYTIGMK